MRLTGLPVYYAALDHLTEAFVCLRIICRSQHQSLRRHASLRALAFQRDT